MTVGNGSDVPLTVEAAVRGVILLLIAIVVGVVISFVLDLAGAPDPVGAIVLVIFLLVGLLWLYRSVK